MRRSPHQLISGRGEPRTKVPHATCEGTGLQGRMGPFCNTASFSQSCARSHIHLGIGNVVFVLFQRFELHLQNGALRRQTCLEIAPERDQQLACDCDDRSPPDTAFEFANTIVEPDAQRAGGLMSQPQPRELNHDPASLGVTSLTDTLITARLAALEMRRRQTDVARQLFAIVKRAVEHFALLCSVSILADAMASRSASIVLIIPITSSNRCSSRRISALSRGDNIRPSAVRNRSSRCIRSWRRGG